jgi:hypothetical protein
MSPRTNAPLTNKGDSEPSNLSFDGSAAALASYMSPCLPCIISLHLTTKKRSVSLYIAASNAHGDDISRFLCVREVLLVPVP